MAAFETTYDGLPISREPPFGAAVVVYRCGPQGLEFLLMHRGHDGPGYEGDWAWTAPAGARLPDEPPDDCARRELAEETGLSLDIRRIAHGSADWLVYAAEAPLDAVVTLNEEHDRFEWVAPAEGLRRCRPDQVADQLRAVLKALD